jgi:nucleoside-diphosphate-sugar epimerase
MKILITGALGYIGTELLYRLGKQTHSEIIAVDNNIDSIKSRLGFVLQYPNIKFINADITDYDQVQQLPKADIIVHLAAVVGYITCGETPELANLTNIVGTRNIASLNTPTIFLSTGSVYGKIGDTCDENVTLNPQTLYAETKVKGEEIIRQIQHTILRPATAFGLSFKVRHDLLVHNLMQDAIYKKHIKLYQPEARRSFYSVQKIAELIEYISFNYSKFDGVTFNVGCESGNVTKRSICNLISKHVTYELEIIDGEDLDSRDYNVKYEKLQNLWDNYNEDFESHIFKIAEYYKSWH